MSAETTYILVTGANSGLGFAICCRLIDEFLSTRDAPAKLCIIPTTRSQSKADVTKARLQEHLAKFSKNVQKSGGGDSQALKSRVSIEPELLDLCNILSVQRASKRLRQKYERIDCAILNAGIGGWVSIDFWAAFKQFFRQGLYFITKPEFKVGSIGAVAPSQLPQANGKPKNEDVKQANGTADARDEPELGEVFTANVFGHYLLVHYLMPLLSRPAGEEAAARVIWVGSIEAYDHSFSLDDFQGMKVGTAYESSKRLTDVLAFTADAATSKPYTDSFFASSSSSHAPRSRAIATALEDETLTPRKASLRASTRARSSTPNGRASSRTSSPRRTAAYTSSTQPPTMYASHPGMLQSDIVQLHWLLIHAWIAVFYLARWFGSPWHHVKPYGAATAMTHLALAPKQQLNAFANGNGEKIKWGSATNWRGSERVKPIEVELWCDEKGVPADKESQEKFFGLGREIWKRMEEMRADWEKRLKDAGYDEGLD